MWSIRNENLFDSLPDAIVLTDINGKIATVNKTAEFLFGYTEEELSSRHIDILLEKPIDNQQLIAIEYNRSGTKIHCRSKNSSVFFAVEVRLTQLRSENDKFFYRLFIFSDLINKQETESVLIEELEFDRILLGLFTKFVNITAANIDKNIIETLRSVGQFMKVDRCSLAQRDLDTNHTIITHSWMAKGIEFPSLVGEGSFSTPWIHNRLEENSDLLQADRLSDLPLEAETDILVLRKYGIKSLLHIPINEPGAQLGGILLDQIRYERTWNQEYIARIEMVAALLLNVFVKKRSEEKLQLSFEKIKQLKEEVENERDYLMDEIKQNHDFENIIGQSKELTFVLNQISNVATTDSTVLILGETGSGKELLARAVHDKSLRKNKPMIKVNCASLPSNIIESELFGHEKGAFTGAHATRKGRFELANRGTLFLDEIGEMPLEIQGKLLRILQEGEFERMGSSQTIKVNVRIIAATNRNLEQEVKAGRFREDLWYRLNVFPIISPPLRNRKDDIPLLVNWLVKRISKKLGKKIEKIPTSTIKNLENHRWPGNVRELENIIERAVISSHNNVLKLTDKLDKDRQPDITDDIPKTLPEIERDYIIRILEKTKWQIEGQNGAAEVLGIPGGTLRGRMRKHRIFRP